MKKKLLVGTWRSAMMAAALAAPALLGACGGTGADSTGEAAGVERQALGLPFTDTLAAFDEALWGRAEGWANGAPFDCGWKEDHIAFTANSNGRMSIRLDDVPSSGKLYSSGEYRSDVAYGFGRFDVRMKPVSASGVVTSFFLYTGEQEGTPWNEIDIEILGQDCTVMQTNYITDGDGGHEAQVQLGFDACSSINRYAIDYRAGRIRWYVNGALVHTEDGSNGPLPSLPMRIMANLWPATGVDAWTGPFVYTGPLTARYQDIRFD